MTIEKKRSFIINFLYLTILLGLFYLFMKYAFSIFLPFLIGFIVALFLQKPLDWCCKHSKVPRKLMAPIFVTLVFAIIGIILVLIGSVIVNQFRGLWEYISSGDTNFDQILESVKNAVIGFFGFLPESLRATVSESIAKFFVDIQNFNLSNVDPNMLQGPLEGIWSAVSQVPGFLLSTIITIISCFFMTADYKKLTAFILRQLPKRQASILSEAKRVFSSNIARMLKAYFFILCITFVELLIGFYIIGIEYALVLALIISFMDILPILGTGTALIPWSIYNFFFGDEKVGIGLLVLYGVIFAIRQFIEPKIVGKQVGLHPIVTLLAMYAGIQLFGFPGLFILPIFIGVLNILQINGRIHLWKDKRDESSPSSDDGGGENEDSESGDSGNGDVKVYKPVKK